MTFINSKREKLVLSGIGLGMQATTAAFFFSKDPGSRKALVCAPRHAWGTLAV